MNTAKNVLIVVLVLAVATLAVWLMMERSAVTEVANNGQDQDSGNSNSQNDPTPTPEPSLTPTLAPSATPTPIPTVTADTFAQNNWLLESGKTGGAQINLDVNVEQPLTLNFDMSDKSYSGFAGCNGFGGTYVSGPPNQFAFGATAATKKYCLESSGLENALFEAMDKVQTYQISGGKLILRGSGETELVYIPAI